MQSFMIVLPAFLIIAFGYLSRRLGYISKDMVPHLTNFFLKVSVPTILIASISKQNIFVLLHTWKLFLALLLITLFIFIAARIYARLVNKNTASESAFFAMSSCMSNAGMLVLPILYQVFGVKGMLYAVSSLIVSAGFVMPLSMVFVEFGKGGKKCNPIKIFLSSIYKVIKTPFFIGTLIGVLLSVLHLKLPKPIYEAVALLAATTAPVALLAVGLDLEFKLLIKNFRAVFGASLFKLILMPAIAVAVSLYFKLSPSIAVALLICCIAPTAKLVFALTKDHGIYEHEGASAVVGTTVLSIITITISLIIAQHIWPTAFIMH